MTMNDFTQLLAQYGMEFPASSWPLRAPLPRGCLCSLAKTVYDFTRPTFRPEPLPLTAHVFAEPDRWFDFVPPPLAYFPFGGGARLCIGEAFARMEGTLVLATIVQRFAFSTDGMPIGIAAHATLRPSRPIVLRAARRRAARAS